MVQEACASDVSTDGTVITEKALQIIAPLGVNELQFIQL
jgi:hypothetical protein